VTTIRACRARSVWDSRGRPTIEVEIETAAGSSRAIAPAGASTGSFEARELRDADGFGVDGACALFAAEIAPALIGMDCTDQASVDHRLVALDGSALRQRLGGNTLIAASMAVAHASAQSHRVPLFQALAGARRDFELPVPEIQIMGGGAHAHRRIDLQDLMVVPVGAADWPTALRWCADVYRAMGRLLADAGNLQGVADEGGFFPAVDSNEQALALLTKAIEASGHEAGDEIIISIDVAATQFSANGRYRLVRDAADLDAATWIDRLAGWCRRYPIRLVEDPASEDDLAAFRDFRKAAPQCRIVGDDLVVTSAERIVSASRAGAIDAALIKPNQAGTLTDAKAAFDACRANGVIPIVSARSGETEDVTIVHLAVGWGAPMLKVGSITRGERTAKWNELTRISEALGHPSIAQPLP
jgi:enolase